LKAWARSIAQVVSLNASSPRNPFCGGSSASQADFDVTLPFSSTTSRAVLLLGLGGTSQEKAKLKLGLREHGFHVSTPLLEDLRHQPRPAFRRWIFDSLDEIDRLAVTHSEINLCGVGQGAALALAVAAERPARLDCLALISPRLGLAAGAMSRWRSLVATPEWLANWHVTPDRQSAPVRMKQGAAGDLPASGHEERSHSAAVSATSWTQLREARRLARRVEDSLRRVCTPTLIVYTEDAATVADVRHVQVHIGSQFLVLLLASGDWRIPRGNVSEITVLKVVEFFNDVARRRALPRQAR